MDRFDRGGYFDNEINEWFKEHYSRFPAEFGWWDEVGCETPSIDLHREAIRKKPAAAFSFL